MGEVIAKASKVPLVDGEAADAEKTVILRMKKKLIFKLRAMRSMRGEDNRENMEKSKTIIINERSNRREIQIQREAEQMRGVGKIG